MVLFSNNLTAYTLPLWSRDAMQARPMSSCGVCVSVCLRVCLSVCVSVTFVNSVKASKHIKFFSPSSSHIIPVFRAKRHSNTPTETPLAGASNTGEVDRNRDSKPVSDCC